AGAGLVLDDYLRAELPAQGDRYRAPQHVRDAAGGEADYHAHRLAGVIGLRRRRSANGEARRDQQARDQRFISSTYRPPAWRSTVKTMPRSSTNTSFSWAAPAGEPARPGGMTP